MKYICARRANRNYPNYIHPPNCWHDISNTNIYIQLTYTPQIVGTCSVSKDLDVQKTWLSGDLDVLGPGSPKDLDVQKTWMSEDLDVLGPECPGTWMSGT